MSPFLPKTWISYLVLCSVSVFLAGACSSSSPESGEGGECSPGLAGECPSIQDSQGGEFAQFCEAIETGGGIAGECTNVCDFAANQVPIPGPGQEGDFCVFDRDCGEGLTCDNDTVGAEMPCHCLPDDDGGPIDCSAVTPGDGGFGAPCRNDGDCEDGLPCCTSTEVSEACGVQVGFCECI